MYIDSVSEDNYHRIKDDISMTLQSQGIVVEGGAAEVSTDAGQPQVHEEDEEHLDKTNQSNCSTRIISSSTYSILLLLYFNNSINARASDGRLYFNFPLSLRLINNCPIIFGPTYFSPLVLTPQPLGLEETVSVLLSCNSTM